MTSRALTAVVAASSAAALMAWGRRRSTISGLNWERTNHAGDRVTLWEGAAYATGAAVGALAAGSPAGALASVGAASFGALDDHSGDSTNRGLRGHLGALTRGEVTTGAVKILGIGMTGLVCAAVTDRRRGEAPGTTGLSVDTLTGAAVVAAAANMANLLDLRPGRALKATMLVGIPLLPGSGAVSSAAAIGAAAGVLTPDLRGESMLGDTGANAAGALLGVAAIEQLGPRGRLVVLGGLTALTLASERVSFTTVIESTPVLRRIDEWGRQR